MSRTNTASGIIKLLKKQQELITYGIDGGDFRAKDVSIERNGTKFTLVTPDGQYPIWSPLLGRVNVLNLIAASAAAYARNVEPRAMVLAADELAQVPGRFERVDAWPTLHRDCGLCPHRRRAA